MKFFKKILLISLSLFVFSSAGFSKEMPKVQVKISSQGTIYADNEKVDLKKLAEIFEKLKKEGGTVWYYRDPSEQNPSEQFMDVIRLISDYKLPVAFSTKPAPVND